MAAQKMAAIQLSCNEANTMNTGIPKSKINLGMLIHAFHPIVQKAEAAFYSKFHASQDYMGRPCFK